MKGPSIQFIFSLSILICLTLAAYSKSQEMFILISLTATLVYLGIYNSWYFNDKIKTLPNLLSVSRILGLCIGCLVIPHSQEYFLAPLIICFWALDGLDGYLARKLQQSTDFGASLDVEVDALGTAVVCFYLYISTPNAAYLLFLSSLRYFYLIAKYLTGNSNLNEPRRWWGRYLYSTMMIGLSLATVLPLPAKHAVLVIVTLVITGSFSLDFSRLKPRWQPS